MANIIKACIDRWVRQPKTTAERMALVKGAIWQQGDAIRVRFLNGDPAVHERVEQHARTWLDYADVKLYFGNDPSADIRIAFDGVGSWSYIGRDCRKADPAASTMNYGWLTPETPDDEVARVVLHEFGHALGCIHEHQNPAGGIRWNKETVYAYYAGPPNYWSRDDVDRNLFQTYDGDLTVHTALDPQSIMMYPIDPQFTEDGFQVGWNRTLSETDKQFIAKIYT